MHKFVLLYEVINIIRLPRRARTADQTTFSFVPRSPAGACLAVQASMQPQNGLHVGTAIVAAR